MMKVTTLGIDLAENTFIRKTRFGLFAFSPPPVLPPAAGWRYHRLARDGDDNRTKLRSAQR